MYYPEPPPLVVLFCQHCNLPFMTNSIRDKCRKCTLAELRAAA